jgi:cadmium resistance transport/sequestration family protein
MQSILTIAIVSFIATNLDDLFILLIFFAHPDYNNPQIVIGQYLGISALILISTLAYFFKFVIPATWISLLGILPIIIGLKRLLDLRKKDRNDDSEVKIENKSYSRFMNLPIISVATITFVNGGDNIGIYTPLFATLSIYQLYFVILIFLIMIGVWCFIGYRLINHRMLGGAIRKYGHIILPFALIFIGILILTQAI